ncbi:PilZ-like domain-containing protein [Trichlorobacter ammonificans]|uniref:Type IV pilus assembly PilZ n=1 Tax=Trichlorobacter ammonificans TaxID=2916410 RepID=A0ABN8HKR8_9BACT|nr:PilZ-like domain-containing protein [Trichlorobacter ammonificans]CAH2031522.1 Type IV pilus assembly PilZ [Trichlorobacter ammonificans]
MSDYLTYRQHFPPGKKVNVAIPVPQGETFNDWAVISSIDEDLVSLQLSRDELPNGVKLSTGLILDIRVGTGDSGYSCRGIIVTEGVRREIILRLIGEIVSNELREFYRIDAFLPIRYFITSEKNESVLKTAWKEKREARIEAEREQQQREKKPWERLREVRHEEQPEEELTADALRTSDEDAETGLEEDDGVDHSWDDVIPLAANISGGGIRILLHHQFAEGDLVPVEIFLPAEPRPKIIDAVCKVVFSRENQAAAKQMNRPSYNTAFQFLWIDERERDTLVTYISTVQLKRIRMMREQYLFRDRAGAEQPMDPAVLRLLRLKQVIVGVIALVLLTGIVVYFSNYTKHRPKNEIELIFEKGFMEYLKKIGRSNEAP